MWQKEQVIDELQKRGKRITEQRNMLLDVILAGNWATCKDIYYEARKKDPGLRPGVLSLHPLAADRDGCSGDNLIIYSIADD